jgi:anti-sigma B factor antagonist
MAGAGFQLETERREDTRGTILVVAAAGELDLAVADELSRELEGDRWRDCAGVVLDLTGLEFMDSSGLRVVLLATRALEESGTSFALALAPDSQVRRLFEMASVAETLPLAADAEAAIAAVSRGAEDGSGNEPS